MIVDSEKRELIYFETCGIMTWVWYQFAGNLLCYAVHRALEFKERIVIESWLMQVYALTKTKFYALPTAVFSYCGEDKRLLPELEKYLSKFGVDVERDARAEVAVADFLKSNNIQVV